MKTDLQSDKLYKNIIFGAVIMDPMQLWNH